MRTTSYPQRLTAEQLRAKRATYWGTVQLGLDVAASTALDDGKTPRTPLVAAIRQWTIERNEFS